MLLYEEEEEGSYKSCKVTKMVVHSKEMPQVCGKCDAELKTSFFRCTCSNCGEVVHCLCCDPRGSDEDRVPPCGPFNRPSCPRGGFASRGRGFLDHSPHFSCPRGRVAVRGGHFDSRPQSPFFNYDRLHFAPTFQFPGVSRGCGFTRRGIVCFPRFSIPEESGHTMKGFSPVLHWHGRGSFGPFSGASRGGAGFSRGISEMGGFRGRGRCRGRGGCPPFIGAKVRGSGECNHVQFFPEEIRENIHDPRDEGRADHDHSGEPYPGEVNYPKGEKHPRADGPVDQKNIPVTKEHIHAKPAAVNYKG